jgi:hypothetical protein
MSNPFRYFNSSPEVIRLVVMMYVRYLLSLRNAEDLLAERGIDISHETVRFWWNRFGPMFAAEIRNHSLQDLAFVIDGAPKIAELAVDLHERLVQVPQPLRIGAHVRDASLTWGEHRAVFLSERGACVASSSSSTPIASRPARVIIRLIEPTPSSSRQTGMPGFERNSRISLRANRLAPTFEAAALLIFGGTTAIPSSSRAAADKTISWVSVSFAMILSSCFDGISRHRHDPAMALGRRGGSASWRSAPRHYRSVRRRSPVTSWGRRGCIGRAGRWSFASLIRQVDSAVRGIRSRWRHRAAAIYPIVESAKLNGLNPEAYLATVVDRPVLQPALAAAAGSRSLRRIFPEQLPEQPQGDDL